MANLVQRLTGDLTPSEELDPQNDKISIHGFMSAIGELKRGKINLATIAAWFNLTAAQQTQLGILRDLYVASTEKTEFANVFKDLLYLGELEIDANYRDIAFIQTRLQQEITDNGGVLP